MKKIITIVLFSIFFCSGGILIVHQHFSYSKKALVSGENDFITIKVTGAVTNNETCYYRPGVKYANVLHNVGLLPIADLSQVNWENKIYSNIVIDVPYQIGTLPKLKIKLLKSKEQLIKISKINKTQGALIYSYILKNKYAQISWDDLAKLRGVGEVTLRKLQNALTIN